MGKKRNNIYEAAYNEYLTGLSLEQVAKQFNVTRQAVYRAFKLRGFALREKNLQPFQMFDNKKFTLRNHGYYSLTTDKRILMHRYVWEFHTGKIPDGFDIHHKDRNKANNDIKNLECISKSDHARKYATGNNQFTKCK